MIRSDYILKLAEIYCQASATETMNKLYLLERQLDQLARESLQARHEEPSLDDPPQYHPQDGWEQMAGFLERTRDSLDKQLPGTGEMPFAEEEGEEGVLYGLTG